MEDKRIIKTYVVGNKANEILNGVIGQMSDGMFEGNEYYNGFWMFVNIDKYNNIVVSKSHGEHHWNKYYINKFYNMTDYEVKAFFAKMIKRIVQQELKDNGIPVRGKFKNGNTMSTVYLNYEENITIDDCVTLYNALERR